MGSSLNALGNVTNMSSNKSENDGPPETACATQEAASGYLAEPQADVPAQEAAGAIPYPTSPPPGNFKSPSQGTPPGNPYLATTTSRVPDLTTSGRLKASIPPKRRPVPRGSIALALSARPSQAKQ